MRDYTGIPVHQEDDPTRRSSLSIIDYYLKDLSKGMGRLQQGLVPDGSGTPIGDAKLSDIYWVLLGRSGNQVGYGGTSPSGTATLASTTDATKGYVYLGEDHGAAYDETNVRLGLGDTTPNAKLHLKHPTDLGVTLLPSSDISHFLEDASGKYITEDATFPLDGTQWGCYTGGGTKSGFNTGYENINTQDNATSYIAQTGTGTFTAIFGLSGTASVTTTWSIVFDAINLFGGLLGNLAFVFTVNFSDGTQGVFTTAALSSFLTTSWATYTLTSFAAGGSGQTPNRISVQMTGTSGGAYAAIGYVSVVSTGGTLPPLQRWETPSNLNDLNYVADANGATTLELSGTPKFRIATTGLEFDIGTPVSGNIWSASDSEGTGAWVTLNSLLDQDLIDLAGITRNRGDLIYGGASAWVDLAIGTAGQFLQVDAGSDDPAWVSLSGDATAAVGGAITLASVISAGGPTGSSTVVPVITWDAKGRLTAVSTATISVGTPAWSYVAKTGTYTATTSDTIVEATSGTFTLTLPTAVGVAGRLYVIKNGGAGVLTVATTSAQTIDGGSTATLRRQYESISVYSDGANWRIF